ncbi:putative glycolipid transfer protein superfamily [Helianthus annuus]|nr:putative glycolipid transfer protein superfamily [Helianthus annuus]
MKRRRETEKQSSSKLRSAIEELSLLAVMKLKHHHHDPVAANHQQTDTHLPIKPFLALCNFLLHLLDKIGPTMVVMRQDISRNIQVIFGFAPFIFFVTHFVHRHKKCT